MKRTALAWFAAFCAASAPLLAAEPEIVPPAAQCPGLPEYPGSARASGRHGRVVVVVSVEETGTVTSISVQEGMGPPFDDVAIDAAKKCTFSAGSRDGTVVPSVLEMAIDFVPPDPAPLETRVVGRRLLPAAPVLDKTPQVSHFQLERADIDRSPGAMEDIARVVQDLPGVGGDPDLLATFFVRGSGPEDVGYYLDGVPLTNPFHLGGFLTLFNPSLIESADFYTGGVPAQYEPALSGVLDVRYATGETTQLHASADVSMNTAKARVEAPTGIEGLSVLLSARRSYFELYFAGLRALHIVSDSYVAPDVSEYLARVHYRRGNHELTATFLHATDGLSFLVKPGEQVLINFAGGLQLSNHFDLASVQDRIHWDDDHELTFLAAFTRDRDLVSVSSDVVSATDSTQLQGIAKADLRLAVFAGNRLGAGAEIARRSYGFNGQVADTQGVPPWSVRPFVDTGVADLTLPDVPHLRNLLSAYVDDTWRVVPSLSLEGGGRFQVDASSGQTTYSARLAAAWTLPTATVLKASIGTASQAREDPLLLDPTYGSPTLAPERARQAVLGFEQGLPFSALLRVESFATWLDHLTVNPDNFATVSQLTADHQPIFQSVGTGFARGIDAMLLGRNRHFSYGVTYGLVFSDRTNPLATGAQTYPSPWDQRHSVAAHASWTPTPVWILSIRGSFHTGRPVTAVIDFTRDNATSSYVPVFGPTNGSRYPAFYELSLRAQREFSLGPLSMAWYAEVLNVTDAQNLYATVYDSGNFAAGTPPASGQFNHLPIRPFLGIRGEY